MFDFRLISGPLTPETLQVPTHLHHTGAWVSFTGIVRGSREDKRVVALDFEAYNGMALAEMQKIGEQIMVKWPDVTHVLLYHRIGRCEVGQIPVLAAIGSPHRKEAFEACEYLMNKLKETVPIWKKEIYDNGEWWVSPNP
ncbi:MAG: molybdenum cofactor biosynthesis protein MoaE [Flavobacteriales bacterium]